MPGLLLVTGDDFGATSAVNAAIARSHREGVLTSASLIVSGDAVEEAVELARELPELSTGLHLVLCDGRAASPPRAIPDLVDAEGRFPAKPLRAGIVDWIRRLRLRPQLAREIRAQIEAYRKTGLPLDHVDGHHHLHMHPVIFDVLVELLVEYRIPWVRLMHEDSIARIDRAPLADEIVPTIFALLAHRHRRRLRQRNGIGCPERVYGLRGTGHLGEERLASLVRRFRAPRVELYAHPDRDTGAGRKEEAALCSPAVRRAVDAAGYRLVSSRALASSAAVAGVRSRPRAAG